MENWQIYLEKFTAWGAAPSVEGYLALFDPEATLQHPGMAKPICGDDIRAFITRGMNTARDYRLVPTNWAARGDTLFIEAPPECAHRRARGRMARGVVSQAARRPRAGRTGLLPEHWVVPQV